jgi:hypothetical protein
MTVLILTDRSHYQDVVLKTGPVLRMKTVLKAARLLGTYFVSLNTFTSFFFAFVR